MKIPNILIVSKLLINRELSSMPHYNTIFNQLFQFIPGHHFEKKVTELKMDNYCKSFTSWKQFLTLLYAQISGKDSLREIESGLMSNRNKLYHLGLDTVAKSTLGDAMNRRDPRIFETMFYDVLGRAQGFSPKHKFKFSNPLYSIDSTTVSLCLNMFEWAKYRTRKGAIKIHTQLDHNGHLPCFLVMTDGKTSDIKAARNYIEIEPDSIYCVDKGYYDLKWFSRINLKKAFFVTRLKDNADIVIAGQHRPPNEKQGILADNVIKFRSVPSSTKYPEKMRAIDYIDEKTGKAYTFITNNFYLSAATIAEIYHQRWQIELFFKWIKQNLKIKSFLGTSENAVMSQIWTAMIYYLLLAYIKFMSKISISITEIGWRIKDGLMECLNLLELLNISRDKITKPPDWNAEIRQPDLFDWAFSIKF